MTRLTSGAPYSIMAGVNNSLNGENRDRADVVGDPGSLSNDRPRGERVLQWFNTAAFSVNQIGRVGNSGRNIMRGPAQLAAGQGMADAITGEAAQAVQVYEFSCRSAALCSGWVAVPGAPATRYAMRFEGGAWRFDSDRRIIAE